MSAKRPAEQNINEKTFDYIPVPAAAAKPEDSTIERNIVQVKRDSDGPLVKSVETTTSVPKPEAKDKPMPLFSNLFQNSNNGIGLFGNVGLFNAANASLKNSQAPKIDFKSNNLFTGNGFTSTSNASKNLFSMSSNQGTIFGFGQGSVIPPVKNGEEDQDGDSAELEKAQNMIVDKSKSKVHYEYKEQVKVLFSGIARKYKKNNGDLVENVEIVLQNDWKNKLVYFMVRLMATKHNIFTGYILENKSQVRVLNKKDQNLQLSAFEILKGKVAKLHKIKIQLDTPQNGKLLFNNLNSAIYGGLATQQTQNKEELEDKSAEAAAKNKQLQATKKE